MISQNSWAPLCFENIIQTGVSSVFFFLGGYLQWHIDTHFGEYLQQQDDADRNVSGWALRDLVRFLNINHWRSVAQRNKLHQAVDTQASYFVGFVGNMNHTQ